MPGRHLGLRCHGEATHPLPAGTPPRQGCPLSLVTLNKFAAAESDNGSSPSTRAFKELSPAAKQTPQRGPPSSAAAAPPPSRGSGASGPRLARPPHWLVHLLHSFRGAGQGCCTFSEACLCCRGVAVHTLQFGGGLQFHEIGVTPCHGTQMLALVLAIAGSQVMWLYWKEEEVQGWVRAEAAGQGGRPRVAGQGSWEQRNTFCWADAPE